ncbi:MAG: flagellar assembly protein FliW [Thermotoga caldifontis]|uniref:flagellar assembly protein FliW n=1 Tax=Thermotoga caldifontis TaxID=1508419 RepID=UPI003C7E1EB7
MLCETKVGEVEVSESKILLFEKGIPGFEHLRKFTIVELPETKPFCWLVSLEDANVALPIVSPWLVRVDYSFELSEADRMELKIEDPDEIEVWVVVTIPAGAPQEATVNLFAPIVINRKLNLGKQVLLEGSEYKLKHRIDEEISRSNEILKRTQKE